MALPVARPIRDLERLDRRLLHIFLAGPGQGEAVAIALPVSGWLLIDSCRTADEALPPEELYQLFRTDAADRVLLLLTHPHRDHASGFDELLEACNPERVAVTGLTPPQQNLLDALSAWEEQVRRLGRVDSERRVAQEVLQALRAVRSWSRAHPDSLLPLHEGVEPIFEEISARICAPDPEQLRMRMQDGTALDSDHANALSAVLRLRFGKALALLGGDLPVSKSGSEVPTGWNHVMRSYPELAQHLCLKVPHHGSRDALHPDLLGANPTTDRAWMLTPFNSSGLPRLDDEDGLDILLQRQSPVLVTARSLSKKFQAADAEGRVVRADLARQTQALKRSRTFREGDTLLTRTTARAALDPIWCVAIDHGGAVVGRWRGTAAVEVMREAQPTS